MAPYKEYSANNDQLTIDQVGASLLPEQGNTRVQIASKEHNPVKSTNPTNSGEETKKRNNHPIATPRLWKKERSPLPCSDPLNINPTRNNLTRVTLLQYITNRHPSIHLLRTRPPPPIHLDLSNISHRTGPIHIRMKQPPPLGYLQVRTQNDLSLSLPSGQQKAWGRRRRNGTNDANKLVGG